MLGEEAKKTREGSEVISFIVADQSGAIVLSLWDDIARTVQPGHILQLKTAYTNLFQNKLRIYVPKFGSVKKIGDFMMLFSMTPNVSLYEWTADPNNPSKFVVKDTAATKNKR